MNATYRDVCFPLKTTFSKKNLFLTDTQTQKSINVMVSAASVAIGTTVYIIGGYNGQDYSEMIKLSLPEDRCHLIKDVTCKNSSGCKVIVVPVTDEKNITSCFSSDRTPPDEYVLLQYCIVFITILHYIYYNNTLYLLQ